MGLDDMSVVDASLAVYGIERLRIADGSVLPRVTTGNTSTMRHHRRACRRYHAEAI